MKREDLPSVGFVKDPVNGQTYAMIKGKALPVAEVRMRPAYVGEMINDVPVDRVFEMRIPASFVSEISWSDLELITDLELQSCKNHRIGDPRSAEDIHL